MSELGDRPIPAAIAQLLPYLLAEAPRRPEGQS